MGDSGSGPPPPPEKSQNIGFICNTGQDPLKNQCIQCWAVVGTPGRANDGPFIAVFESSIPSSTKKISNDPRMHVVLSPLNEKKFGVKGQCFLFLTRVPTTDFFGTYYYWSFNHDDSSNIGLVYATVGGGSAVFGQKRPLFGGVIFQFL